MTDWQSKRQKNINNNKITTFISYVQNSASSLISSARAVDLVWYLAIC